MFHTSTTPFGLRTISLLGGEILILKAMPVTDKTSRYVLTQERAVEHTLSQFGVTKTHMMMYSIRNKGLIEAVYRKKIPIMNLKHTHNLSVCNQYPEAKYRKYQLQGLGVKRMLLKTFLENNISELEIPFKPNERKKYPATVWEGLHKSVLVNQLQHYKRTDTIESLINTVIGGDDLGGLTIDNVVDMWLESLTTTTNQIVGSALGNSKIRVLYDTLTTEREVECSEAHSEIEDRLIEKGTVLPVHNHTVMYIDVNDDNREQFNEFVNVVLKNFDSDTYGELPEEYAKARESDIESLVATLKDVVGDNTDLLDSLITPKGMDDSGDFV